MSFAAAQHNFLEAARHGMDARLYWPGVGEVTPDELVLRQLLPMAHEGQRRWGVADEVCDRYLDVIAGRSKTGGNSATWQVATVQALQDANDTTRRAGRDAAAVLPANAQQRARAYLGYRRLGWGP